MQCDALRRPPRESGRAGPVRTEAEVEEADGGQNLGVLRGELERLEVDLPAMVAGACRLCRARACARVRRVLSSLGVKSLMRWFGLQMWKQAVIWVLKCWRARVVWTCLRKTAHLNRAFVVFLLRE